MYALWFLYNGLLPWLANDGQCHTSHSSIQKMKMSLGMNHSLKVMNLPTELITLLKYAQGLAFMQKPDYEHLRTILHAVTLSLSTVKEEVCILSTAHANGDGTDNSSEVPVQA